MKPFFSIIVPIYNVEKWLARCMESICNQSYNDYEIICVNDGSTDRSGEILANYLAPNVIIVNQENRGLSAARNAGTAIATGEWILYVDSDDYINRRSLEILHSYITQNTGCKSLDIICFGGSFGYSTDYYNDSSVILSGWDYFQSYSTISTRIPFTGATQRAYRKELLQNNNISFKEGIYHEDALFTPIVCYYARQVLVIPDILYYIETREGSITTSRGLKHYLDIITCANELANFFIPKNDIKKDIIYQIITYYYKIEFTHCTKKESHILLHAINWHNLKKVSRSSIKNRLQYLILRTCPMLIKAYKQGLALIHH